MANIYLKPAMIEIEGETVLALVPDPDKGFAPLSHEGGWKPRSQYWIRRMREGGVVESDPNAQRIADAPAAVVPPAAFTTCGTCVTPEACIAAARCVKAPLT